MDFQCGTGSVGGGGAHHKFVTSHRLFKQKLTSFTHFLFLGHAIGHLLFYYFLSHWFYGFPELNSDFKCDSEGNGVHICNLWLFLDIYKYFYKLLLKKKQATYVLLCLPRNAHIQIFSQLFVFPISKYKQLFYKCKHG